MRDLESVLREAMAEDVAAVIPPPDLAGQVRARHVRHQRMRVAAALAAAAVIVVAVPVATTVVRQQAGPPPAEPAPAVDEVDGVRLTYLPDGLRRDPVDGMDFFDGEMTEAGWTGWTARTGRWNPDTDHIDQFGRYYGGLRVTVFRGEQVADPTTLAPALHGWDERPAEWPDEHVVFRGNAGGERQWLNVVWQADDDLVLRVRIGDDLEHELDRVIEGVRIVGSGDRLIVDPGREPPPAGGGLCDPATNLAAISSGPLPPAEWDEFGGAIVHHVPDALEGGFSEALPSRGLSDWLAEEWWMYSYRWSSPGDDDPSMLLFVYCADWGPQDAGQMANFASTIGWPDQSQPYTTPTGRPGLVADSHFLPSDLPGAAPPGRQVLWLEQPGVMIRMSVDGSLVSELDEILASVRLRHPGPDATATEAGSAPVHVALAGHERSDDLEHL
jgi:hypothetical protein